LHGGGIGEADLAPAIENEDAIGAIGDNGV
jgi:hypothetical protein